MDNSDPNKGTKNYLKYPLSLVLLIYKPLAFFFAVHVVEQPDQGI